MYEAREHTLRLYALYLVRGAYVSNETVPHSVRLVEMPRERGHALGKGGQCDARVGRHAVVHGGALDVHVTKYCPGNKVWIDETNRVLLFHPPPPPQPARFGTAEVIRVQGFDCCHVMQNVHGVYQRADDGRSRRCQQGVGYPQGGIRAHLREGLSQRRENVGDS